MTKILDQKAPAGLELARRVKRHGTQNPAGNTSVTEGTFRVASDEGLIVEGSERITGQWFLDGVGEVTGSISIFGGPGGAGSLYANGTVDFEGTFTAAGVNLLTGENRLIGPTYIEGALTISGAVDITGDLSSTGSVTLEGAVGISGAFTSTGDVFLNGTTRINGSGFITGALTITGATKVQSSFETLGDTRLGGTVDIAGTTTINGTTTVNAQFWTKGQLVVEGAAILYNNLEVFGSITNGPITMSGGQISIGGGSGISISASGINANDFRSANQLTVLGAMTVSVDGLGAATSLDQIGHWLGVGNAGKVMTVAKDIGGPLGGDLEWPFDESLITDEFGPRDSPGGIGSTDHKGMDFGPPAGTDIKVAGSGTVVEKGGAGGFGNYVVVQHSGGKRTLYAHMVAPSPYNVGDGVPKGAIVGQVGNTGNSTGPHLHLEVHLEAKGWEPVNPRDVIKKPWS